MFETRVRLLFDPQGLFVAGSVTVTGTLADRPATQTVMVALPTPAAYAMADGMDDDDALFTISRDTCTTAELLRGEAVCVVLYSGDRPSELYFAGISFDW